MKDFALENPSSLPVLVQVVPLSLYPSPQAAVSALSHKLGGETAALKHTDELDADVFTLQDLEEHNVNKLRVTFYAQHPYFCLLPFSQEVIIQFQPIEKV